MSMTGHSCCSSVFGLVEPWGDGETEYKERSEVCKDSQAFEAESNNFVGLADG